MCIYLNENYHFNPSSFTENKEKKQTHSLLLLSALWCLPRGRHTAQGASWCTDYSSSLVPVDMCDTRITELWSLMAWVCHFHHRLNSSKPQFGNLQNGNNGVYDIDGRVG